MKSFLSLFLVAFFLLSGCKATFWYSPEVSFHNTDLPEAETVSIQANSGTITLENAQSNSLTEIRSKGKNKFEWNQRNDTLFISIPGTTENEFEIWLTSTQKLEILSQSAIFNVIKITNPMEIQSQNSRFHLDQPPTDLVMNSKTDSVFVGLSPDIQYNHEIKVDSTFFRLIKNGNETEISRISAAQDTTENKKGGIVIIVDGSDSDIQVKNVGLIW